MDNIDAIDVFTAGMQFDAFAADRKSLYAVVRALEIVSEASRRLPAELKQRHPEVDWAAVAAAGNVYSDEYEGVDESLIWRTVRHELAVLRTVAVIKFDRVRGTS